MYPPRLKLWRKHNDPKMNDSTDARKMADIPKWAEIDAKRCTSKIIANLKKNNVRN